MKSKKIINVDIRATSIKQFWTSNHEKYFYLWNGALNKSSIKDIDSEFENIQTDKFASKKSITNSHNFCKDFYEHIIPKISQQLNKLNNVNYSIGFYKTLFGYFLFRIICITYDKFKHLEDIDLDKTSLKLLKESSYYIPFNHFDFFSCFTSDFGTQQLVSIYYNLFSEIDFDKIEYSFPKSNEEIFLKEKFFNSIKTNIKRKINELIPEKINHKIKIGIIGVFFTKKFKTDLRNSSNGLIEEIKLLKPFHKEKKVNFKKRLLLKNIVCENDYEKYFFNCLIYCLPKSYLEYFKFYKRNFLAHIKKSNLSYIVSENWITDIPTSFYIALAKEKNIKLLSFEHAVNTILFQNTLFWHEKNNSFKLITSGWRGEENIIQGGFCLRNKNPNQNNWENFEKILFVDFVRAPYLIEFGGNNCANSRYLKQLKLVNKFLLKLPETLKPYFLYRPREVKWFWNSKDAQNLEKISIDKEPFELSINNSRLIIINHFSTGIAEIINNRIPFIIIQDKNVEMYNPEKKEVIDSFIDAELLYFDVNKAINKILFTKNQQKKWWASEKVSKAIKTYEEQIMGSSNRVHEYLLSLINV